MFPYPIVITVIKIAIECGDDDKEIYEIKINMEVFNMFDKLAFAMALFSW